MSRRGALRVALVASAVCLPAAARAQVCDSNLMIVLDRSCSMDQPPTAGDPSTKWELALMAIQELTTTYAGQLRFGLILFPDEQGASCAQDGPIYVNVGPGNESAVVSQLMATQPTGPCVTNIDTAMAQVADDPMYAPGFVDPEGRRAFVLLVSDGKQSGSCGGSARDAVTAQTISDLYADGHPTYVVGFGGGVDPDSLNMFAVAGGVPRAGDPMYYQAGSGAELQMALDAIAGDIVGDPELGGCAGTPCPDGRCFGAGETCVGGVCVAPAAPDAGAGGGGDGGAGGGDGGPGGGDGDEGGCDCRVDGRAAGSSAAPLVLAGLALLGARRRRTT